MTVPELLVAIKRIRASIEEYPAKDRFAALLQQLGALEDENDRLLALEILTATVEVTVGVRKVEIVLLVHGIRTHANWGAMVRDELEAKPQRVVIPLKYGYFDAFRFWFPFLTRRGAISKVYRRMRAARTKYPDADLSIIAHSFGTYAVTKILRENADIRLRRLVFCGAIVRSEFDWENIFHRIEYDVVNDCGRRDVWPVLAKSLSWGYGPSGTFGFGTAGVFDRFHNYKHSDYFERNFGNHFS